MNKKEATLVAQFEVTTINQLSDDEKATIEKQFEELRNSIEKLENVDKVDILKSKVFLRDDKI